jgi:hypothetical protein
MTRYQLQILEDESILTPFLCLKQLLRSAEGTEENHHQDSLFHV